MRVRRMQVLHAGRVSVIGPTSERHAAHEMLHGAGRVQDGDDAEREKMVRQAGVRVARLGARTCAFRAVFAKCTVEQRANRMREVQGPGFEGLPASEADLLAMYGYISRFFSPPGLLPGRLAPNVSFTRLNSLLYNVALSKDFV